MNREAIAKAFNQWMDDYTKDPDKFEEMHKTAMKHLNEKLEGREPSYGDACAVLLESYIAKQT